MKNKKTQLVHQSKCESCNIRKPYFDKITGMYKKWCKPCCLTWQRNNNGQSAQGSIIDLSPDWRIIIPERYQNAQLEDLPDKIVEKFVSLSDDKGMYLWGLQGRGKTYTMTAYAKHLWQDGWDIQRITYEHLMLKIRDTYKKESTETEMSIIQPLLDAGKLFIEDVGTVVSIGSQESDFSLRTFLHILDTRLENCLATYITSNKSVIELSKSFDARIASRIQQACEIIEVKGNDKRNE